MPRHSLLVINSNATQLLRMDGITFTGDVSIMTKLMSISSWMLERSAEEDLQLQTIETAEGFRVATRGLLTVPDRDGAEMCRAIYCMEFDLRVIFHSVSVVAAGESEQVL